MRPARGHSASGAEGYIRRRQSQLSNLFVRNTSFDEYECIDLKEIDFKKIGLKSEPLVPSKKEFVHHIRF